LPIGIDNEDLARLDIECLVGFGVRSLISKTGIERFTKSWEQTLHSAEALDLEDVWLLDDDLSVETGSHSIWTQEERSFRQGVLAILLNAGKILSCSRCKSDRS
jgi:hypothetical protein